MKGANIVFCGPFQNCPREAERLPLPVVREELRLHLGLEETRQDRSREARRSEGQVPDLQPSAVVQVSPPATPQRNPQNRGLVTAFALLPSFLACAAVKIFFYSENISHFECFIFKCYKNSSISLQKFRGDHNY